MQMEELRYKGTTISTTNQYFVCFYLLYFAVDIFINPLLIGISKNLITQGLLFTLTLVLQKLGSCDNFSFSNSNLHLYKIETYEF